MGAGCGDEVMPIADARMCGHFMGGNNSRSQRQSRPEEACCAGRVDTKQARTDSMDPETATRVGQRRRRCGEVG